MRSFTKTRVLKNSVEALKFQQYGSLVSYRKEVDFNRRWRNVAEAKLFFFLISALLFQIDTWENLISAGDFCLYASRLSLFWKNLGVNHHFLIFFFIFYIYIIIYYLSPIIVVGAWIERKRSSSRDEYTLPWGNISRQREIQILD